MKTYELGENEKGDPYIKCLRCGLTSYHPEDIKNKYCGKCHKYHEPVKVDLFFPGHVRWKD